MKCNFCEKILEDTANFCSHCGKKQDTKPTTTFYSRYYNFKDTIHSKVITEFSDSTNLKINRIYDKKKEYYKYGIITDLIESAIYFEPTDFGGYKLLDYIYQNSKKANLRISTIITIDEFNQKIITDTYEVHNIIDDILCSCEIKFKYSSDEEWFKILKHKLRKQGLLES